jgi:hypothetical protein
MGVNSSAPTADLTVAKRDLKYMMKLLKEKRYGLAKLISKNCRYVDDLKGAGPHNSLFQNLQISYGLIKKMKSHTKKISEN